MSKSLNKHKNKELQINVDIGYNICTDVWLPLMKGREAWAGELWAGDGSKGVNQYCRGVPSLRGRAAERSGAEASRWDKGE